MRRPDTRTKWRRQYDFKRKFLSNLQGIGVLIAAVLFVVALIWYGFWYYSQPLDYQIEMRCRQGDSVACLSLPGNR